MTRWSEIDKREFYVNEDHSYAVEEVLFLDKELMQRDEVINRIQLLADTYRSKAIEANPNGYTETLNDNNSISYWRIAQEIQEALGGESND